MLRLGELLSFFVIKFYKTIALLRLGELLSFCRWQICRCHILNRDLAFRA
jgi:hypothetical protein